MLAHAIKIIGDCVLVIVDMAIQTYNSLGALKFIMGMIFVVFCFTVVLASVRGVQISVGSDTVRNVKVSGGSNTKRIGVKK